ncbi:MAG: hypothetical protein KAR31_06420 [Candidatus Omnitrophica bacterium]|nr:hypothetical protein [Candidatus Omnitrophota bacterium]
MNIIRKNEGAVLCTSKEVVIFSMPGTRIKPLVKEILNTGGVFADFGDSNFDAVSLLGTVNILIYFSE